MGFRLRAWLNPVAALLALVVAAGIYGGIKFIPPYWQANKVDNVLSTAKWEAAEIPLYGGGSMADALLERVKDDVIALGVDERTLDVYFAPDYTSIHADYVVVVSHPFDKTTTLEFERSLDIPRDED